MVGRRPRLWGCHRVPRVRLSHVNCCGCADSTFYLGRWYEKTIRLGGELVLIEKVVEDTVMRVSRAMNKSMPVACSEDRVSSMGYKGDGTSASKTSGPQVGQVQGTSSSLLDVVALVELRI